MSDSPHTLLDLSWVEKGEDCLTAVVNTTIHPKEALLRTCYAFTDRCYLFLDPLDGDRVRVRFRKRRQAADLTRVVAEFGNALIDHTLRVTIARETQTIRELIVTQAFAEADLDGD
jgi:His-Xaa-Ser system protein HxsD